MVREKRRTGKSNGRSCNESDENRLDDIIQQKLLDQLGAYGDNLLGEDNSSPAPKKLAPSRAPAMGEGEQKQEPDEGLRRNGTASQESKKNGKRKAWEEAMELNSYSQHKNRKIDKKDKTRKAEPEVVVFTERAKKTAPARTAQGSDPEEAARLKDLSHEVYQFGISGFDYEDKEKMEIQRAIKLGAKPPKNAHIPYKELMKSQKEKREAELKQREIDRKMGLKTKKRSSSSNTKKSALLRKTGFWQDPSKDKKFHVDGQVGRYRQGIQVLSKQDLHRIKKSGRGNMRSKVKKGKGKGKSR